MDQIDPLNVLGIEVAAIAPSYFLPVASGLADENHAVPDQWRGRRVFAAARVHDGPIPKQRPGGCIERVITDYGPSAKGGRIVDMYRPDLFKVCGCGSWSGTTEVTIRVY